MKEITQEFDRLREWFNTTYGRDMTILTSYNKEDKRHEYVLTFKNKYNVEKCSAIFVEDFLLVDDLLYKRIVLGILPRYKKLITEQMQGDKPTQHEDSIR